MRLFDVTTFRIEFILLFFFYVKLGAQTNKKFVANLYIKNHSLIRFDPTLPDEIRRLNRSATTIHVRNYIILKSMYYKKYQN